jgi:cyclin B
MRSMLIDWLVEVHNHFNLQPDTLYLTVNYIDRFLASVPVKRENFQLVALTALLIASKFEEIHPVDIEDLVYICERSYTAKQIVQFEKEMLQAFKFHLVVPTCSGFLEYYNDKLESELEVAQLANFFSEQTLLDFHLCAKYVPSVIAASSVLLAQIYYEKQKPSLSWVLGFEEITGYYAKDIWCCVHDLSDMLASLSYDVVAVRTKFGSDRFGKVSKVPHMNIAGMNIEDLV